MQKIIGCICIAKVIVDVANINKHLSLLHDKIFIVDVTWFKLFSGFFLNKRKHIFEILEINDLSFY